MQFLKVYFDCHKILNNISKYRNFANKILLVFSKFSTISIIKLCTSVLFINKYLTHYSQSKQADSKVNEVMFVSTIE